MFGLLSGRLLEEKVKGAEGGAGKKAWQVEGRHGEAVGVVEKGEALQVGKAVNGLQQRNKYCVEGGVGQVEDDLQGGQRGGVGCHQLWEVLKVADVFGGVAHDDGQRLQAGKDVPREEDDQRLAQVLGGERVKAAESIDQQSIVGVPRLHTAGNLRPLIFASELKCECFVVFADVLYSSFPLAVHLT